MAPITNQMANARREKDCFSITAERKYYHAHGSFVKRSLRPDEWQINHFTGTYLVPRLNKERLLNEAACLRFIAEKSNIPVPKLYSCFEDDDAVYLITEYVEGVAMSSLTQEQRHVVEKEVERHIATMKNFHSDQWGGPSGIVSVHYVGVAGAALELTS
ncbi:hypothetical protein MRB53_038493 [Persea americana]|nr:hypothetical protein MRB53_038493 [Persea americana]